MFNFNDFFPFKIDWLKKNCQLVHYFGLGFIQLKIDKEYRIHFYTDELPPIVSEEDVHNHRYDFTSVVVKGSFTQEIFEILPNGNTHVVEDESCRPDLQCQGQGIPCGIKLINRNTYLSGGEYWLDHSAFHRVLSSNCITVLKRSEYKKEFAQVIRKQGNVSPCPFSKKVDETTLWEIIEGMI